MIEQITQSICTIPSFNHITCDYNNARDNKDSLQANTCLAPQIVLQVILLNVYSVCRVKACRMYLIRIGQYPIIAHRVIALSISFYTY